jgi:hypothetical protein
MDVDDLEIDAIETAKVSVGTIIGIILAADVALDIIETEDDDSITALFVKSVIVFEIVDNIVDGGIIYVAVALVGYALDDGIINLVFTMADI